MQAFYNHNHTLNYWQEGWAKDPLFWEKDVWFANLTEFSQNNGSFENKLVVKYWNLELNRFLDEDRRFYCVALLFKWIVSISIFVHEG